MSRLIDADKLMEDVRKNSESYFADDFAEQWVNRQQTVDAIPIDWLMQKADEWKSDGGYACDFGARLLTALINDWRRKNGT